MGGGIRVAVVAARLVREAWWLRTIMVLLPVLFAKRPRLLEN